jgi:hypothetical protein
MDEQGSTHGRNRLPSALGKMVLILFFRRCQHDLYTSIPAVLSELRGGKLGTCIRTYTLNIQVAVVSNVPVVSLVPCEGINHTLSCLIRHTVDTGIP